jgi:hypothetical protein
MAIWAVFKDEGWVDSPTGKKRPVIGTKAGRRVRRC